MTTITLDFSSSYRAITNDDLNLVVVRDSFGFDGKGQPQAAVTLIGANGPTVIKASNPWDFLQPYLRAHSPTASHLDLVDLAGPAKTFLRFDVVVKPQPIWENYVKTTYTGMAQISQYSTDLGVYDDAIRQWQTYVLTNVFNASAATLGDKGGTVGHFSSTAQLAIEDFALSTQFYAVNVYGSRFADTFGTGEQNDTIHGGGGADSLQGNGGDDSILGGSGADSLDGGAGNDTLNGDAGNDHIVGDTGNDLLFGGAGDDSIYGGAGKDVFYGGDGNDSMQGSGRIFGNNGDDTLTGEVSNDLLVGGPGMDVLQGGQGKDTLTGGSDADFFQFDQVGTANADKITDFEHGIDRIWLSAATFAGVHAAVDAGEFRLGTVALDGDDRIIYDPASGRLWYDPDGTLHGKHSAPQVLFAIIANHAPLTFDDFFVV